MSIIAAFIKKLSRMALTAPVSGTLLVIELIINLLVRHDTCRALVHREQPCSLESDPYDPDETDISRCHATESSLWEIKVRDCREHDSVWQFCYCCCFHFFICFCSMVNIVIWHFLRLPGVQYLAMKWKNMRAQFSKLTYRLCKSIGTIEFPHKPPE